MKRQSGIHKEDKTKIKSILLVFLQNLFFAPTGELSDDEQDADDEMEGTNGGVPAVVEQDQKPPVSMETDTPPSKEKQASTTVTSTSPPLISSFPKEEESDDFYNLIFVNSTWYILLRLHQVDSFFSDYMCSVDTLKISGHLVSSSTKENTFLNFSVYGYISILLI